MQGCGQEAAHIGVSELGARVVCGHKLGQGQQLLDFTVAVDPVGSNCGAGGCAALEDVLMQGTDSHDRAASARGA